MTDDAPTDVPAPEVNWRELPEDVVVGRAVWNAQSDSLHFVMRSAIDAHIRACQFALDCIASVHRRVVDETDIDLDADTRWVAIWEVTGRCIALGNALLDQLRLGYTTEAAGTARVLTEALDLALAVTEGDEPLVLRWLGGKQITAGDASREADRLFKRLEAGSDGDVDAQAMKELSGRLYGLLSSAAHNRRSAIRGSVERDLRLFSYGPHPHPLARTEWVDLGREQIARTVTIVGWCAAQFFGGEPIAPLVAAALSELQAAERDHTFALGEPTPESEGHAQDPPPTTGA